MNESRHRGRRIPPATIDLGALANKKASEMQAEALHHLQQIGAFATLLNMIERLSVTWEQNAKVDNDQPFEFYFTRNGLGTETDPRHWYVAILYRDEPYLTERGETFTAAVAKLLQSYERHFAELQRQADPTEIARQLEHADDASARQSLSDDVTVASVFDITTNGTADLSTPGDR